MFKSILSRAFIAAIIGAFACSQPAFAHPFDGWQPAPPPERSTYATHGNPAEWSFGDIQFAGEWPAWETLSDAERKMTHGALDPRSGEVREWLPEVLDFAARYYDAFGMIPAQVTSDAFWQCNEPSSAAQGQLQLLSSPLDGHTLRLDAQGFSPGDMYIKALSTSELYQLAPRLKDWEEHWLRNIDDGRPTELLGPVLYYRIYGARGVILDGISYTYHAY
jgi:hypothetical protein